MSTVPRQALDVSQAVSVGVQRSRVGVVAAYPCAPATAILETLSDLCADGRLDARFVAVESERSALATCAGAAQAGVRAFTATSAHGLAHMHEMLHWCAGARLPVVLVATDRAADVPRNIFVDQSDAMSQRDTGWIQYHCESSQDALDTVIQAYAVAERVHLPAMVCLDGAAGAQPSEPVTLPDQAAVDAWLPPLPPVVPRGPSAPHAWRGTAPGDALMERRVGMQRAMEDAVSAADEAATSYGERFGCPHPLVERHGAERADVILVTSGTVTGTARVVLAARQAAGDAVALAKLRLFRPFPFQAVRDALHGAKKVAVLDRSLSLGHGGILASEIRAALSGAPGAPRVFSFVGGPEARDGTPDVLDGLLRYTLERDVAEFDTMWVGATRVAGASGSLPA